MKYSASRKKQPAAIWTDLEVIVLSEISQAERERNSVRYHLCVGSKTARLTVERWLPGARGRGGWGMLRVQTCNQYISRLWSSNAQHNDCTRQYCIINLKLAKRLDLNYCHHKKEMIIIRHDRDVTQSYGGYHTAIYKLINSAHCNLQLTNVTCKLHLIVKVKKETNNVSG